LLAPHPILQFSIPQAVQVFDVESLCVHTYCSVPQELQLCASGVGESSPQEIKQMLEIVIRDN